jgi:tellurite resistance protein TerC
MFQSLGKESEEDIDYSHHWAVRHLQKILPVYPRLHGNNFFVRTACASASTDKQKWCATPLFLCLVVIEISDIMFAFDSVPAVLAITPDPFLVYTSNIFAILGLRSMFFLLTAAKRYLRHLEKSVISILAFIGIKMMLDVIGIIHLSSQISLAVVVVFLTAGILASFLSEKK